MRHYAGVVCVRFDVLLAYFNGNSPSLRSFPWVTWMEQFQTHLLLCCDANRAASNVAKITALAVLRHFTWRALWRNIDQHQLGWIYINIYIYIQFVSALIARDGLALVKNVYCHCVALASIPLRETCWTVHENSVTYLLWLVVCLMIIRRPIYLIYETFLFARFIRTTFN